MQKEKTFHKPAVEIVIDRKFNEDATEKTEDYQDLINLYKQDNLPIKNLCQRALQPQEPLLSGVITVLAVRRDFLRYSKWEISFF